MQKIVFCLLALVLSACNLAMPGSSTNVATPISDTAPPTSVPSQADWVTYQNTTFSYSLQHPANLTLVENAPNNEVLLDDQISVQVLDVNPEEARGGGTVIEEANDTTIGTYTGRQLRGYVGAIGGNNPHSIEQTVLPHNGKYYVLTVTEIKRSKMVSNGREIRLQGPIPTETLALFQSILSTFRFTD